MSVSVLGPVTVHVDDEPLDLMPALRSLVAALVVDAPRVVGTDSLLVRLWEDGDDGSVATLQSHVSRLRRRLGADALLTQAPGYRLDLAPDAVDAVRFRGLVRAAREEPDPAAARELVAEAVGLWRGGAYADVDRGFARTEADRLAEQLLEAHELAADLDLRLGRHHRVAEELAPLVDREPLREGLRGLLMVALYRCGRQAAALETYEAGRHLLAEELGVDPGPALRQLHEQVLRQDPSLAAPDVTTKPGPAPAPAIATAPTGLVEPPTELVGRAEQVDDVVALLDGGARLVTLTGAGGVGKTRLALAVARRLRQRYPDGVVTVPLATVRDPQLVLPTVAHALGVPGGGDLREQLLSQLGDRAVLLVLDNAEHLLDAAPDISWLVGSAPQLTVLVTSRAPLRVGGEQERLVDPLDLPDAVSLFVERARAVAPGFRLDTGNQAAVAEVCRRLAGIPLALELAAARLRMLGPDALLERLDEALASGPRDLPERQRTMQATLDWSYRLLDEPAQRLFRTLSVFTGGWTLDLLQAVTGEDVLGPLTELVEHSLVGVGWTDLGPRYSMLEPTLQHARRLATAEEWDAAVRAHALACLDLGRRAALGYQVAEQVRWLAVVDDEHANLLAAFERSASSGEHDTAAHLAWSLWLYWWFRGHSELGRRVAVTALSLPGTSPWHRNRARIAVAAMAFAQGDFASAGDAWSGALATSQEIGDEEAEAHSVAGVGIVALSTGDPAGAEAHHRRAIELAEARGDVGDSHWTRRLNHVWLGTDLLELGRREEALEHFRTGLRLADDKGDRLGAFMALWNIARTEAGTDDDAAHEHLRTGIRLSHEVADLSNLSCFLDALVVTEVRRTGVADGDKCRWAALLGAAEGCRDLGNAESYGYYLPDAEARAAATEAVAAGLGADRFAEHFRNGRVLGLDDLVALALRPESEELRVS